MKFSRTVFQVNKHTSIDGVDCIRHNFEMLAMTSFHAEKCCHLVSKHEASALRPCTSIPPVPDL